MSKKQHRAFCRKLARFLAKGVKTELNMMGLEMALLINFNLTVTNQTLLTIYQDYKKALTR